MNLRRLRLRAVWLLVVPFFLLARPTEAGLVVGGGLALAGLALRAWAAGVITKERTLATTGPYAYTRNPLYLGSLLLGLGATLGGGHWVWPALFLAFYVTVYGRTMARERQLLTGLFEDRYRAYVANVPALVPRITPWRDAGGEAGAAPVSGGSTGFSLARYLGNREWEAALGALVGFGLLLAKLAVARG